MEKPEGDSAGRADDAAAAALTPDDEDTRASLADRREAMLAAREIRADVRDAAQVERGRRAMRILADADERDNVADARDAAATTRDTAASLHSFLHDDEYEHGPALKGRRSAALDRTDSQTDRHSAAADRFELTKDDRTSPEADDA